MKRIFLSAMFWIIGTWACAQSFPVSDSIAHEGLAVMEGIRENTMFHFWKDDRNFWVLLSLGIAIASLVFGIITYTAQKKTEGNTKKLSKDAQRSLLNDLVRHLYRNLIITLAVRTKLDELSWDAYPSEEHLIKLKIPLENIHLDVFYGRDAEYRAMHDLYLKMRNYNEEVDVALAHLSDPSIDRDTKMRDMGTLEFKASFLTERIVKTVHKIWGKTPEVDNDILSALKSAHNTSAGGNIPVDGYSDKFRKLTEDRVANTAFADIFGKDRVAELTAGINEDVAIERMLNARGEEKIHMIRFNR
ncbi:MAG TPA: hypothetical protein IAC34_01865 [Candidatus Coprenecus stercoripullorum]|nr:hypothetical protein [Candidatus Coprenecus stercoripullorum]